MSNDHPLMGKHIVSKPGVVLTATGEQIAGVVIDSQGERVFVMLDNERGAAWVYEDDVEVSPC